VVKINVNEEVCIGCGLCRVYCQVEHSKSKDILKAFKREVPRPLSRARVERKAEVCFSLQCRQCDEPWCVYCCLTGALVKNAETGVVTVDTEKCMGCWTCVIACPNGAMVRDTGSKVVVKCDMCPEREIPACVTYCPNEALVLTRSSTGELAGVSN